MRIEWNHKLIKRDLFAASKGFCQPPKTTRRIAQRKCAFLAPSPSLSPTVSLTRYVCGLYEIKATFFAMPGKEQKLIN